MARSAVEASEERQRALFDELCARHMSALRAAAQQLCRDRTAANDLVQDTLERAWKHLATLQDEAHARAWMVRIMRNAYLDQLRRRRAEVPLDQAAEPVAATADEPTDWQRFTLDDVRRAIEKLEEPFRSVAILHDVDGLSYQEIATRLAIPYATAATRVHRARRQIRSTLQTKSEDVS